MEKDFRKYEWTVTYETELDFTMILSYIIDYNLDIDFSIGCGISEALLHMNEKQSNMKEAIGAKIHEDVVKELTKRGYKVYNNRAVR